MLPRWLAAPAAVIATGLLVACGAAGPGSNAEPAPTRPARPVDGEVVVFAASSLTDVFRELGERYQAAHPDRRITFSFGASSQLRAQLEQGARVDVFASANQAEMDKARAAGLLAGPERVFARNRLVVIVPRGNPGEIATLQGLARPGLKLVTASPEVPIGVYTQELLEKLARDEAFGPDFRDRVNANVVSREPNVRQLAAKVSLGEADGAVVYATDVTPDLAPSLGTVAIPERFNNPASYPVTVVRGAANAAGGEAFVAFLLGADGQAVLKKWGFAAPS